MSSLLLGAVGVAAPSFYWFLSSQPNVEVLLAILNGSLVAIATGIRSARRNLDMREPILWIQLALLTMYMVHPLYVSVTGEVLLPYHESFSIRAHYGMAILLGGIALGALNVGYTLGRRVAVNGSLSAFQSPAELPAILVWVAGVATVIGLAGLAKYNFITLGVTNSGTVADSRGTAYISDARAHCSGIDSLDSSRSNHRAKDVSLAWLLALYIEYVEPCFGWYPLLVDLKRFVVGYVLCMYPESPRGAS